MALGTDFALCACVQATLRETGMPRLVMRLITVQAIRASTFCADRPEAPADQSLVPVESGFNQGPLPVTDGFLPTHSAFPGEGLDVPVALSGLGLRGVAQDRV